MENKNVQIVREAIEEIANAKHFDRTYEYYSEQCILHNPPYVGLGLFPDDSSGERLVIKTVAANSPSSGKVQVGDELVRVRDANGIVEGFDKLKMRLWGQGKLGSEVTLTLLRDGETLDITLRRGRVEGFDQTIGASLDGWQYYATHDMPDVHTEINQIFAAGDLVAYYAINNGTNMTYQQSAVWGECGIMRLENGKIVESWAIEDHHSMLRQFGFRFIAPGT
jgi:predicted SnoaL-like aldol condensation-catalyzing enzyme